MARIATNVVLRIVNGLNRCLAAGVTGAWGFSLELCLSTFDSVLMDIILRGQLGIEGSLPFGGEVVFSHEN